ncbi:hypothetical protein BDV96DRAFT_569895 [Lophiotrema nucula]|uniref:Pentatricopeptide repeat protein n=1 Tax=Lophiotrema nucula TaxID=690887 RepID=A0A6A5ZG24_9PLEO|nr:hypothetical protein BDV96DRAFT_569895 [Lophiotrema nucula]
MLRALGPRISRPRTPRSLLPARTIHTRPGLIPDFANTWDPTTEKPATRPETEHEQAGGIRDALEESARRAVRKQLYDKQQVVVSGGYRGAPLRIRLLNRYLWLAHSKGRRVRAPLWRSYVLAKSRDTSLIGRIPDRAWDILWATQSVRSATNKERVPHLRTLYEDMKAAGRNPTLAQRYVYLRWLFYKGQPERALQEWDNDYNHIDRISPEHLELGVVMHALADHPDRSLEIMEELSELYPDRTPSVMLAVFRAHTRSTSTRHRETARMLYARFRDRVTNRITLATYDGYLVGFLEARDLSKAKVVFGEMATSVTSGHLAHSSSKVGINEILRRLHLLYRLGTNIEKMTSIALFALSVLPKAYHRHLFGDLMKSAVIRNAPEAGAQVLDMMFRRRLDPDAFYFNLLLKCLLRTKDTERVLKAENIGWQMANKARLSGVEPKHSSFRNAADAIFSATEGAAIQPNTTQDMVNHVPPANVTTYALLMQHHSRKFQWEQVDYLARRLKDSGIQPNSAVMTVLMNSQCRQGKYDEVWNIYQSLTSPSEGKTGVFPDGKAIRCLWKSLRLALGEHSSRERTSALPTPRDLLKETIEWWDLVKSRYDAERFRIGFSAADHGAISALVMHCFSYTKDLQGSLVAMHVIRQRFRIFPTDKAAPILQRHVAWTDMQRETEAVRTNYSRSGIHKARVNQMGRIYYILQQQRFERMGLTGTDFANLSDEEAGDLGLNILSEFVRVVLKRQHSPDDVEAMIDEVKEQIGLPNLKTGDMTASEVV